MSTIGELGAPFPYFGGKQTVAARVWQALGNPKAYLEPFFGSGAVLLARPDYQPGVHVESVCDADGFVANCWRALQAAPDEVAKFCDWPVNHACLNARRRSLLARQDAMLDKLGADDKWFDAEAAGYWIWAASCWIGSGLTRPNAIPQISDGGVGVHKLGQIPHLNYGGKGVHKLGKRPNLTAGFGKGCDVHKASLIVAQDENARHVQEPYNMNLYSWFRKLSERLRYVRVVCGDWKRVCGGEWQDRMGICGIFFDPPYGHAATRDAGIYHADSLDVAAEVREWARARGDRPSYRIVLAGYYEEHESLLAEGWTCEQWKAQGGYSSTRRQDETQGSVNRHREALFFSPHCVGVNNETPLFTSATSGGHNHE